MKRKDKAHEFLDKEFMSLSNLKTVSHIAMSAVKIPGAKKRLHRNLINRSGNEAASIASRLGARKVGLDEEKAIKYTKAGTSVLKDFKVPSLGKLLIKN